MAENDSRATERYLRLRDPNRPLDERAGLDQRRHEGQKSVCRNIRKSRSRLPIALPETLASATWPQSATT